MLSNDTRKVYIVNNIKSDNIEQVIFILRTDKKNINEKFKSSDIVLEAQAIIDNYAKEIEYVSEKFSKNPYNIHRKKRFFLRFLSITSVICMTAFLIACFLSKYFI